MAERQVTLDGRTHVLPETFFVIATQNPVESHGAYPLPEAQLDRFAMRLRIGYPDRQSEINMLAAQVGPPRQREREAAALDPVGLQRLQEHVATVAVHESLLAYLVDLAAATRSHRHIRLGLSPRGLLTWQRVAQARAHLQGREFVIPEDIQDVAFPVLCVRLSGDYDSAEKIVREILDAVPVPVGALARGRV
jgi:MoxR-like ATPase